MTDADLVARRFEEQRPRLRAVAHRMLGSAAEADDGRIRLALSFAVTDRIIGIEVVADPDHLADLALVVGG
ncbi:hypothetical protein [Micromonospora sp. WMMA1996]|uniref:hypothetical protein n=1 Tax=Micromonospora sp. WMMA1996 TaxID=2039878 RepID=UPI0020D26ACB